MQRPIEALITAITPKTKKVFFKLFNGLNRIRKKKLTNIINSTFIRKFKNEFFKKSKKEIKKNKKK